MMARACREGCSLVGWAVLVVVALLVNGIIFFANYVGAKTSLELANYGMAPLGSDRLIGRWVGAFFGEATVADFLAAGLAAGVGAFAFIGTKVVFQVPRFIEQRRAYRAANDVESAAILNVRVIVELLVAAALVTGLVLVWIWDLHLFLFRSLAEGLDLHDPVAAAATVPNWKGAAAEHGGLFIVELARVGGRGYIALSAVGCLALEYCLYKAGIAGGQFLRSLNDLFADDEIAVPTSWPPRSASVRESSFAPSEDRPATTQGPLFEDIVAPATSSPTAGGTQSIEAPVEVLGSRTAASIRPSDARRNPDAFYVDDVSGAVWDRVYWKSLHEDTASEDAKAA